MTTLVHAPDAATQSTSAELHVHLRGRRDVRVRARRRPVRPVHLAVRLHRPRRTARTPSRCARPTPRATRRIRRSSTPGRSTASRRRRRSTTAPAALTNSGTARFEFSSEAGATFQCSIDAGALDAVRVAEGPVRPARRPAHLRRARGRRGRQRRHEPGQPRWTIERVAPETTITSGPASLIRSTSASFEFTSEPGVEYECSLDERRVRGVRLARLVHRPRRRRPHVQGPLDGRGRQRRPDAGGERLDDRPRARRDRRRPAPANPTNSTSASLYFSSNEAGISYECSLDGSGYSSCSSPAEYTDLAAGTRTSSASAAWTPSAPESPPSTPGRSTRRPRRRSTSSSPRCRHRTTRPRARA